MTEWDSTLIGFAAIDYVRQTGPHLMTVFCKFAEDQIKETSFGAFFGAFRASMILTPSNGVAWRAGSKSTYPTKNTFQEVPGSPKTRPQPRACAGFCLFMEH